MSLTAVAVIVVGVIAYNQRISEVSDERVLIPTLPRLGQDTIPSLRGQPAPDFAVDLIEEGRFSLARHFEEDGRPLILNLWASWCIPCRNEMPALQAASARHPNVAFLGIAIRDDPVAAEEFADEMGVTYPLAVDERDRMTVLYPWRGLPTSFLISGEGVIVATVLGEMRDQQIDSLVEEWFR